MQHNKTRKKSMLILFGKVKAAKFEKGFASSTTMNFVRLRNELVSEQSGLGVPWRVSIGPMESDVFGLSNTKHL